MDDSDLGGTLPQPTMVMNSTTQTCGTMERIKRQWKEVSDNGKHQATMEELSDNGKNQAIQTLSEETQTLSEETQTLSSS